MSDKEVQKKFVKRELREKFEEPTEEDKAKQELVEKRMKRISFWWVYALVLLLLNAALIIGSFFSNYTMYAAPALIVLTIPLYVGWLRTLKVRMHETFGAFIADIPAWALLLSLAAVAYTVVCCVANIHGLRDGYGVMKDGSYFIKTDLITFPITKAMYDSLQSFVCKLICGIPVFFMPMPLIYITSAKIAKKKRTVSES